MNGSDGTSVVQLVSDVVSPEAKSIVSPTSDLGTDDISVIINAGVVSLISDIVGVGTGDGCAAFWVIWFPLFGRPVNTLVVSNLGFVSPFDPLTTNPSSNLLTYPIPTIAVYGQSSFSTQFKGEVFMREEKGNEVLRRKVYESLTRHEGEVAAIEHLVVITWLQVPYAKQGYNHNTFQLTIASTKNSSYIIWIWKELSRPKPDQLPIVGYFAGTDAQKYGCYSQLVIGLDMSKFLAQKEYVRKITNCTYISPSTTTPSPSTTVTDTLKPATTVPTTKGPDTTQLPIPGATHCSCSASYQTSMTSSNNVTTNQLPSTKTDTTVQRHNKLHSIH